MYCKKCGRKLDDDMRFCDRCGQSVRQSQNTGKEAVRREIKELQEERLNRKQKLQEKEQEKKRINIKKMNMLTVVFIVLFSVLIIAVITYIATMEKSKSNDWFTKDGAVEINATEIPTQSPVPTDKTGSLVDASPTSTAYTITAELNADGYREHKTNQGLIFPYPGDFIQQRSDGVIKLSLYDKNGGASIILKETGPVSGEAKTLMSEYAKAQTGKVKYSRAGNGWYVVETEADDIIIHSKCVIVNNISVSYEFSYSKTSAMSEDYAQQIQYIDEHFTSSDSDTVR